MSLQRMANIMYRYRPQGRCPSEHKKEVKWLGRNRPNAWLEKEEEGK